MRLLFSSIHRYLDPSSGAALCSRELLELLAGRGADCQAEADLAIPASEFTMRTTPQTS